MVTQETAAISPAPRPACGPPPWKETIRRPYFWLALAWLAFRRKDVILGVVAWQFLVPYVTFYGLMPAFALVATRWPWAALAISLAAWVPYSQVLLPFL